MKRFLIGCLSVFLCLTALPACRQNSRAPEATTGIRLHVIQIPLVYSEKETDALCADCAGTLCDAVYAIRRIRLSPDDLKKTVRERVLPVFAEAGLDAEKVTSLCAKIRTAAGEGEKDPGRAVKGIWDRLVSYLGIRAAGYLLYEVIDADFSRRILSDRERHQTYLSSGAQGEILRLSLERVQASERLSELLREIGREDFSHGTEFLFFAATLFSRSTDGGALPVNSAEIALLMRKQAERLRSYAIDAECWSRFAEVIWNFLPVSVLTPDDEYAEEELLILAREGTLFRAAGVLPEFFELLFTCCEKIDDADAESFFAADTGRDTLLSAVCRTLTAAEGKTGEFLDRFALLAAQNSPAEAERVKKSKLGTAFSDYAAQRKPADRETLLRVIGEAGNDPAKSEDFVHTSEDFLYSVCPYAAFMLSRIENAKGEN